MSRYLLILFSAIFTNFAYAGETELEVKYIDNETITKLLTIAQKQDLWELPDKKNTNTFMYLYSIGHEGSCVPETHYVCSKEYFLALRGDGYGPYSLFRIGEVGDIKNIKWKERSPWGLDDDPYKVKITFSVYNYPDYVFKRNKELTPKFQNYELHIDLDPSFRDKYNNINRFKIKLIKSNKAIKTDG